MICRHGCWDMVDMLLKGDAGMLKGDAAGMLVEIKDAKGRTPLTMAAIGTKKTSKLKLTYLAKRNISSLRNLCFWRMIISILIRNWVFGLQGLRSRLSCKFYRNPKWKREKCTIYIYDRRSPGRGRAAGGPWWVWRGSRRTLRRG